MKNESNHLSGYVSSVNYHLWQPCNMRCKFCFATFNDVKHTVLPKGHLPREQAIKVVEALSSFGFRKITFVGGEPTLCPWLVDLIHIAKCNGLTTMLVTNGSRLSENYLSNLKPYLDWICLSIDSLDPAINECSGRKVPGRNSFNSLYYSWLIKMIKKFDFRLKINTVVHRLNYRDNISEFINKVAPDRWKVFKILPVEGQNNGFQNEILISNEEFETYIRLHESLGCKLVAENNEDMRGSYAMVDPAGRFYDSSKGYHVYSSPILEVGCKNAYNQVQISKEKFFKRGGEYNWSHI